MNEGCENGHCGISSDKIDNGLRPVNVTLPVIGPKCGQIYRGKFKM